MTLKERARKIKLLLPALMVAMRKAQTPWPAKVVGGLAVVYALSPVDLVPDFIPVLGLLDDLIILPALIALALKLIPGALWATCLEQARLQREKKSKSWLYAIPILVIWALIIYWLLRGFKIL